MAEYSLPDYDSLFPDTIDFNKMNIEGLFWETKEVDDLNKTLIFTTLKLREINKTINKYERARSKAKLKYSHTFRETLLETEGKTESARKLMAEIACEELETQVAYLDEIINELTRTAFSLRSELDTLKTVGHNIRQEMKIY